MFQPTMDAKTSTTTLSSSIAMQPNSFKTCSIFELYNILQFPWQKVFLDIRSYTDYKECHLIGSVNIPFDCTHEHMINEVKKINSTLKNIIGYIYVYSSKHLMDTLKDIKFCNRLQMDVLFTIVNSFAPIIILDCDFQQFHQQMPYLCTSTSDSNLEAEELKSNTNGTHLESNLISRFSAILEPETNGYCAYPSQILNDELFLGNINQATNADIISNLKITHVVNMTENKHDSLLYGFDHEMQESLNIQYLDCSLIDSENEPIEHYFEIAIDFIHKALIGNSVNSENENKSNCNLKIVKNKVLVHCFAGVSRSASIVIAYLMKMKRMKFESALDYVSCRREIIGPNDGFVIKLKAFEKSLLLGK